MAGKLSLLAAFGAGYVLGARAGRARYEQIADATQRLWHDPRVQKTAEHAQEVAKGKAEQAQQAVKEKIASATSGGVSDEGEPESSGSSTPSSPRGSGPGASGGASS